MSTAQDQRTVDFGRGLYSGTNRFTEPRGTVPRGSNLIWLRRGAMRTTDGSLTVSSLNGAGPSAGQSPFRWIGRFSGQFGIPSIVALQVQPAHTLLIDVSGGSYSGSLASYPVAYPTPSFVQAASKLAIALGPDTLLQLWNGSTSTAITNSWLGNGKIPAWTASTAITDQSPIVPTVDNGHVYVATNSGTTGGVQPTFPTTSGATVQDGSVLWVESGPSHPPLPLGAASVFYHGGFLFVWGTSATYNADNLNGPDSLWQSDLQNFNSWNPLDQTFVGKGDGTSAQGGGVLTLSESGIAATAQLVLFKDTDTYIFLGFFPNWSLFKVPSGVGCVAPGSVQFSANVGLFRMSYRGVALFDGQQDIVDEITDPIRAYLFGDDEPGIQRVDWQNINLAMSSKTDNPKMYLLAVPLVNGGGALTRIFAYDLTLKAWATPIDLPFPISAMGYVPQNDLLLRTYFGSFNDGTIQVYANNSASTWYNGSAINWSVRTPEIGQPETPGYIRRLNVRGQTVSGGAYVTGAVMNYQTREGVIKKRTLVTPQQPQTLTCSLTADVTCLSANIDLSGTGRMLIEGLGYQYTPKPPSRIGGGVQQVALGQVETVIYQQGGTAMVSAGSQTLTVTLPTSAPNANYLLTIAPNWNTTWWSTNKNIAQFQVFFATPAPPDGTGSIDYTAQIFS